MLLIPLVALYEAGALLYLRGLRVEVLADRMMGEFLRAFGLVGLLLPAVAMLSLLLVMHVLRGDSWRVRPIVIIGMALEAALWALPLTVFSRLVGRAGLAGTTGTEGLVALDAGAALMDQPWQVRATISLGAGLYEEFIFRLVLIALVHLLANDLLRMGPRLSAGICVLVSAVAFAFYHPVMHHGELQMGLLAFYLGAGVFFAFLYLARGFGIVVGAHVVYDLIAFGVLGR
jgi:hypothetical protein